MPTIQGNIAYFAASEVPLREDLQANTVTGLPPWFIRDGSGGNEWLPIQNPQPGQAIPYEILPAAEMPHLINPLAGFFVNANNDPAGTVLDNNPLNQLRPGGGLYYLNAGYDFGLRAQRVTELIQKELQQRRGSVSFEDMQRIQADVVLPDAPYFVPLIRQALARGMVSSDPYLQFLASQPGIQAVVARLAVWDYTAPTGIAEGYDAADEDGSLASPTDSEKANSVAATLYSVWRGQFIRNTIDATLDGIPLPPGVTLPKPGAQLAMTALKSLIERPQPGIGASGVDLASRPEELHPRPLTERCVNLSIHTAPIKQTHRPFLSANARRDTAASRKAVRETCSPVSCGPSAVCTSSSPKPPTSC